MLIFNHIFTRMQFYILSKAFCGLIYGYIILKGYCGALYATMHKEA